MTDLWYWLTEDVRNTRVLILFWTVWCLSIGFFLGRRR